MRLINSDLPTGSASLTQTDTTVNPHGFWKPGHQLPRTGKKAFSEALRNLWQPFYVVDVNGQTGVAQDGLATLGTNEQPPSNAYPLLGWSPSLDLASLGDPGFKSDHGLTFA